MKLGSFMGENGKAHQSSLVLLVTEAFIISVLCILSLVLTEAVNMAFMPLSKFAYLPVFIVLAAVLITGADFALARIGNRTGCRFDVKGPRILESGHRRIMQWQAQSKLRNFWYIFGLINAITIIGSTVVILGGFLGQNATVGFSTVLPALVTVFSVAIVSLLISSLIAGLLPEKSGKD